MNSSNFSFYRNKMRLNIDKTIQEIIYTNCDFNGKNGFKTKLKLRQLIDRYSPESRKFQLYVVVLDNIISDINAYFPFINMEGITLEWSTKEIIDIVIQLYSSIYTFTMKDLKEKGMVRYDKHNNFIKCQ